VDVVAQPACQAHSRCSALEKALPVDLVRPHHARGLRASSPLLASARRTHLRTVSVVPMPRFMGDRAHRVPLRGVIRAALGDQPHSPLPQLRRVLPVTSWYDPILLKGWSLRTRRGGSYLLSQNGWSSEACPTAS
jgi:hypothetical protein